MNRVGMSAGAAVAILLLGGSIVLLTGGKHAMTETQKGQPSPAKSPAAAPLSPVSGPLETATFGAGCFWCTEAVFQQLKGVQSVVSGYSGGSVESPSYEQVCSGRTGHAEAIQIAFDPKVISYPELLEVFWQSHDPTTLNRQGNDTGTQYRSAIFYRTPEQKRLAEEYKKKLDDSHAFDKPIVTEITAFSNFFPAEGYHQNYFNDNSQQPYCSMVIRPKVEKVKKVFHDKLKSS